jgi:ribosomal subunit interface protein
MVPFKVTSRDIPLSQSMISAIEMHLENLERFLHRLVRCEIVLSRPHVHHKRARNHHIRLHVKTRLGDIIINREPDKSARHTSFKVALYDAFRSLERQLVTESRKLHHHKKVWREIPEKTEELDYQPA